MHKRRAYVAFALTLLHLMKKKEKENKKILSHLHFRFREWLIKEKFLRLNGLFVLGFLVDV